ncbi:MAG: hypothetical protein M9930_07600 [Anaerolineae bacterium]|nr:hypothetical protein [Anaerolineae bacterium]
MTTRQATTHPTDQTPVLSVPLVVTDIERVEVIGEPWHAVPDDWLLFNAPRPIRGSVHDGEPLIFTDQFINGTCYAAVNPTDPQAQHLIDHNRALGACLLQAISLTEHTRRLRRWVEGEYIPYARAVFGMAFTFDQFPAASWDTQYRNDAEQRIIGPLLTDDEASLSA